MYTVRSVRPGNRSLNLFLVATRPITQFKVYRMSYTENSKYKVNNNLPFERSLFSANNVETILTLSRNEPFLAFTFLFALNYHLLHFIVYSLLLRRDISKSARNEKGSP